MAASTPRKRAPAKKAAAKNVAKSPADERTERNQANFDGLRARAVGLGIPLNGEHAEFPPYTIEASKLGDGIDTDVVFKRPSDLVARVNFTRMISSLGRMIEDRRMEEALATFPDILIALSDWYTMNRVLRAMSLEPDGDALLFALSVEVLEHFAGKGALQASGGTTAS